MGHPTENSFQESLFLTIIPRYQRTQNNRCMIERVTVQNFKSLKQVDLRLGRMNLFIGPNASGKSNFFDALRVLQGIGNGFTISEILDGKPKSATSVVWDGIRGGSAKACFVGSSQAGEVSITASGTFRPDAIQRWEYDIAFTPEDGKVTRERLQVDGNDIYDSGAMGKNLPNDPVLEVRYYAGRRGKPPHLKFERSRPVLGQFARDSSDWTREHSVWAVLVKEALANVQRVDPSPAMLRDYSQAHMIDRMGEHGENFAALVRTICQEPRRKEAYLSWLKQLRPLELDDVGTLRGAVGEPLFMLREGGREFPAKVLSDGTLRFAAITAAFFQPDMPAVMTIEEIENGIHASRVRLLVELIRSRSADGPSQVMATSHSPIVLAWLEDGEYSTTFYCHRDNQTGESKICPLTAIPRFAEVVRKQPISDLFAEGWLESAL